MTDKCYSLDGETFYNDFVDILDQSDEELKPGDTYYEADQIPIPAGRIVSMYAVESMLENFDNNVYDETGELLSYPFESVDEESKKELRQLIIEWIDKHTKLSQYYRIGKPVKKTFTKDDLE